jgi:hypothetical protein
MRQPCSRVTATLIISLRESRYKNKIAIPRGLAAEPQEFELALGDDDRQCGVAQARWADAGRQVQHVGSTGRAQVLLPGLEIAGGIDFQVRLVAAQPILANVIGARGGSRG